MRREVRWERMFPDELDAALAECPVVYLPYGLCEPHGPQNAVGMDALRPHAAAQMAAREFGGIVAPPEYWHCHDYGIYAAWAYPIIGEARSWLTAVPPWMFLKNICYHVRMVDSLGFHAAVIFSGHAGPHNADLERLVALLQPHFGVRLGLLIGLGTTVSRFDDGGPMGDHAGRGETSMLWAVEPDCVDLSRIPPPDAPGPHFAMAANAREADRRAGERQTADLVQRLGEIAADGLAEYDRLKPERRIRTFGDVEAFWRQEMEPGLADMESMQDLRPEQQAPPPDSQWHANWRVPGLD